MRVSLLGLLSISSEAVTEIFYLLLVMTVEIIGSLDEFNGFANDLDLGILGLSHNLEVILRLRCFAIKRLESESVLLE